MISDLIYYTPQKDQCTDRLGDSLAEICRERGMPYHQIGSASPETLTLLRQARFVVVWNGSHPFCSWVMNVRRRNGLAVASAQRGFIDGDNHLMFDRGGSGTDSELVRQETFDSVLPGDVLAFRQAFPQDRNFKDPRTIIVGECRTHPDVLGFGQFIDEREYLAFCVERCGKQSVVYRPPIGNYGFIEMHQVCRDLDIGFSDPEEETWNECVAKYSSAIGTSSHRLIDFAVRGKPAVSIGESLLQLIEDEQAGIPEDFVFAECWKRQFGFDASTAEVAEYLSEVEGFEEFLT